VSGLSNVFLFPVGGDLDDLRGLLFGNGQAGWMGFPSLDNTAISANTLGSGIETFRDLYRGNNGTQATADQRSAWGRVPKRGRVNLLTNSAFTGAVAGTPGTAPTAWTFAVSTGTTVSYDGRKLTLSASSSRQFLSQAISTPNGGSRSFIFNIELSADQQLQQILGTLAIPGGVSVSFFVNGVSASFGTNIPAGAREVRMVIVNASGSDWNTNLRIGIGQASNTTGQVTMFDPQFESGTSSTAYQRVGATAFDITEPGQTSCYYLQPDGLDDGYVTGSNLDLSGTDKVTVFAAVRRLSDAARGTVAELTSSIASNDGAFHLTAPNAASATYGFESKGTTLQDAVETSAQATAGRIITAVGDISGDLSSIQVDNGTAVTDTSDQGTGNFSNSLLYLFRRGGASLPANLQCFAIIVAGGLYSATTAARVKTILSKYTPGVTL